MVVVKYSGQSAVEFLMVVGISLTLLMPIIYYSAYYGGELSDIKSAFMIKDALRELELKSILVYTQGTSSKVSTYITLPSNVVYFSIENNKYIVIRAKMSTGEQDFFKKMPFNLTYVNLPNTYGKYRVIITSLENGVKYEFEKVS